MTREVWKRYGKGMGEVWERYGRGMGRYWRGLGEHYCFRGWEIWEIKIIENRV